MELNRILRPGGFFVWSATPVYRDDDRDRNVWNCKLIVVSVLVFLTLLPPNHILFKSIFSLYTNYLPPHDSIEGNNLLHVAYLYPFYCKIIRISRGINNDYFKLI
jgi:hypothetical protein